VGDEVRGGVLVMNETGQAGTATIEAAVAGARLGGDARKTVELPAGGRAAVSFPIKVTLTGEIRLRFAGALGPERDGLEVRLPARHPTSPEAALVAQGETDAAVSLPIALPAGVMPGTATLDVSLDPDGLAGIEEGLRALVEYPYGCLEQTTSRLIPLVAVEELARGLGIADLDGPRLQRFIRVALEKIGTFQAENGGFGLWRGSAPEPYLTAFALWGLKLAADAGHEVPKARMDEAAAYLRKSLGEDVKQAGVHNELGELGSRAFALYVLNLLGKPEPAAATRLLEQKERLPRYGLAFLAQALGGALGREHARVAGLLDELLRAADRKPGGLLALVRERPDPRLGWYMSSDARTSAIATDAFLYLRPAEPDLPALVRGLLAERRGGVWRTTQENLYALVALTHFLKARQAAPAAVRATLGGKVLVDEKLPTTGAARIRRASVALDEKAAAPLPLVVEAREGKVHYQVRLRFRRDLAHEEPREAGLVLRRQILDPTTGQPTAAAKAGGLVRVRVTITAPEARERVAVSDFLPAGLEAVNTRFATTAAVLPGAPSATGSGFIQFREIRDERVDVFADHIGAGGSTFEYYARATTPGVYVLPAATAEKMYEPEVRARTPHGVFRVTEK
jgi:hypothetical protein